MTLAQQEELVSALRARYGPQVLPHVPFPRAYCVSPQKARTIYLGCDPSNKHSTNLRFAFALPHGDPPVFRRFVEDHASNLHQVGLSWDVVYAQNLCQDYFADETSSNLPLWKVVAADWIPLLREELAVLDHSIPVLLTSAYLYHVLVPGRKHSPGDFYRCKAPIPIASTENHLGRPLIPFYRNRRKINYHLTNPLWEGYRRAIRDYVDSRDSPG